MTSVKRVPWVLAVVASFLIGGQATVASAGAAQTLTVAPDSPLTPGNCFPFGNGDQWLPFLGYVYKDVPAFQLKTGDSLAFDLGAMNEVDIQVEIALAATTTNGSDAPSQPFTTVVTNTQTPANPRGDTTPGNFELTFTAQAPFNFPGGGLIIRFTNPSASYAADATCTPVLGGANVNDSSGYFAERYFSDPDGIPPYDFPSDGAISGFRLRLADVPPSSSSPPTQPTQPVTKKKCKKHKHKRSAESAKCKKKKKR
jgi:hypothetical protein